MLNAAPARELPDEVISHCDVLIVNESELATLTGTRGAATDREGMIDAQRSLLARGAKAVEGLRVLAGRLPLGRSV